VGTFKTRESVGVVVIGMGDGMIPVFRMDNFAVRGFRLCR
jgi:hypothetical protein